MRIRCAHVAASLIFISSKGALAFTCKTVTNNTTLPAKTFALQRDLPVGSLIGQIESDIVKTYNCSNESPSLTYQEYGIKAFGSYKATIDNKRVYATNIEGIGYAVGIKTVASSPCGADVERWVNGTNVDNVNHYIYCAINGMFSIQPLQAKALINLYKTATTTGAGVISGSNIGSFILRNNKNAWMGPESFFSFGKVEVTTLSCTLGSASIDVRMGEVPVGAFKGAGTSPSDVRTKSFSIPLTCAKGTSINLKLDGTAHDATQGMLKVSGDAGSATGVAIQVLYDDQPVKLGTTFKWKTAESEGTYSIPLKARYVQTGNSIVPGVANGAATFTLTYQ
ncbi:major type 1 subunit fimbrin (pilin) [Burkholderia latens]